MRVLRSSLLVAATALVAAACGDKVNITPPVVPPPTIHSVQVAPSTAVITVGQSVSLAAVVSADAGVTATVVWSTSNSGVSLVTQGGIATGMSAGTAGICATASAAGVTSVVSCANVVVVAPSGPSTVQVSPSTSTVTVGTSVTLTASVNAPAGVTSTVTWTPTSASATVTPAANGLSAVVTGLTVSPGLSICATATVSGAAPVSNCATVVVQAPTNPTVQVSPSSATITIGQTVNLTAAINGVTNPTITWSTNNAALATIPTPSTGATVTVTGVAAGTVAICAAAQGTGTAVVTNCAQVTVQAPPAVLPATVQIASITKGGLNFPAAVPPFAVTGQIEVSVSVNSGTSHVDSVEVLVGATVAGTQTFSAAQAAKLSSAGRSAPISAQALLPTIVFSINTAQYAPVTSATPGSPTWPNVNPTSPNGQWPISAKVFSHQDTTRSATASQSINLIFGNPDAWIVQMAFGAGTNSQASAAGYTFKGGPTASVIVTAIPVLYSGLSVSKATINFGTAACDGSGVNPQRTQPLANVAGSPTWTATFARTALAAAAAATVDNYEFNAASAVPYNGIANYCAIANAGGGESPWISAFSYTNATDWIPPVPVFANTAPFAIASPIPVVRLDDQAPQGLSLLANVGGRTGGWFNDAVQFNVLNATSPTTGIVGPAATDLGVGGITYAATVGGSAATTPAGLAETSNSTTYTVSETATDLLGNISGPKTEKFGVDRTQPTLAAITQPKAPGNLTPAIGSTNAAFTFDPNTGFAFVANDPTGTGGVTGSGFFNLAATPITMSESARSSTGTTWWCPLTGTYRTVAAGCTSWVSGTSFLSNMVSADNGVGNNYFLTSATIADQAGNYSVGPFTTNLFAVDGSAGMLLGNLDPPSMFPTSNSSYAFSFGITVGATGLDIALTRLGFGYSGFANDAATGVAFVGPSNATFWAPDMVVDAWNAASLTTSTTATVTVNNMLTNFEVTSGLGVNNAALNANPPTFYQFGATNQPGRITMSGWGIPGSSYTLPTLPMTNGGGLNQGPAQWFICATAAAATACPTTPAAVGTVGNVTISRSAGGTAIITAVAAGTTGVFNNPFSQVQFWAYDPGTLTGWRLIGIANNSSNVTDGMAAAPTGRNWQFNMAFTANATNAPDNGVYRVLAIGIGAPSLLQGSGVALATPVGGITVTVAP